MSFMDEWREFFRLMGTKMFWALPDQQRLGALEGLWYAGQAAGVDNQLLLTATAEYDRRQLLVWLNPTPSEPKPSGEQGE